MPFPHWRQMNDPWILTQVEKDAQLCVPRVHSLMSIQNKRVYYTEAFSVRAAVQKPEKVFCSVRIIRKKNIGYIKQN